jgi:prepilin-type processing-associated H-X9-DG protein
LLNFTEVFMQLRLPHRLTPAVAPALVAALALGAPLRAQPAAPRAPGAPAAAAPAAPAQGASAITPYLDDATLLVARIDPGSIDWEAWGNWLTEMLKAAKTPQKDVDGFSAEMKKQLPLVKKWSADFTKAGGKSVYVIAHMSQEAPVYAVVPLGAGADSKALGELLKDPLNMQAIKAAEAGGAPAGGAPGNPLAGMKAEVIGKALYFGPPAVMEDIKNFTPAERPELEQAFAGTGGAAAGGAPIRVAFNPSEGLRGVMVLSMKKLPDELGGGPVAPVANGFRWAALAVQPPTATGKPSLQLTVQAKDAASAKTLSGLVDAAHKKAAEAAPVAGGAVAPIDPLFDVLAPKIPADKPDQLRVALDDAKLRDLAAKLAPALAGARRSAILVKSANNERQIGLGLMMYAAENKGQLPKNLPADLKEYFQGGGPDLHDVFTNPSRPEAEGYVYAPPADKITAVQNASETPVLWEAFDQWPGEVNVLFMDGHVDRAMNRADFDKIMKNNPNAAKGQPVKIGAAPAAAPRGR